MPEVEVVYATPEGVDRVALHLPANATVSDAIRASGIAERHPEIDLGRLACGIYGERVPLGRHLADGDRVEIYRPLAVDPKEARRLRARGRR